MPVYLGECLCPSRHCVLAVASADAEPSLLERTLRETIRDALRLDAINPWCGLCGARSETWAYRVSRTRFATMAAAEPALRALEAAQVRDAATLKRLGLAYDPPEARQP